MKKSLLKSVEGVRVLPANQVLSENYQQLFTTDSNTQGSNDELTNCLHFTPRQMDTSRSLNGIPKGTFLPIHRSSV